MGLKKPITVSRRRSASEGEPHYDLVCGQGRLEAFIALNEEAIPAIVIESSKDDQLLMSLVENLARRKPSTLEQIKSITSMHERGKSAKEIAAKTNLSEPYVRYQNQHGRARPRIRQHERNSYNSCRDRHCPKCQSTRQAQWLAERLKRLLPVPYFHVVFTLPEELNPIGLRNRQLLYNLLFATASQTLLQIARDDKHLGAQIGFTAVLHTWSQTLLFHLCLRKTPCAASKAA